MRIKNFTDMPDETIRKIIAWVRPSGISNFDVRLSNHGGRGSRGVAYAHGSCYHSRSCPFIVVSIPKKEEHAREIRKASKGYLAHTIGSRMEALLFITAHELRHLWQGKVRKGWRVYGSRGQYSERDADAYAIQCLRKFRRGEYHG